MDIDTYFVYTRIFVHIYIARVLSLKYLDFMFFRLERMLVYKQLNFDCNHSVHFPRLLDSKNNCNSNLKTCKYIQGIR